MPICDIVLLDPFQHLLQVGFQQLQPFAVLKACGTLLLVVPAAVSVYAAIEYIMFIKIKNAHYFIQKKKQASYCRGNRGLFPPFVFHLTRLISLFFLLILISISTIIIINPSGIWEDMGLLFFST